MVAHYLKEAKVSYITDGDGNTNLPLKEAGRLAATANIAVEFHCNSFHNPTAQGVEALAGVKDKELSRKLCSAVSKHMNNSIRGGDGGWKGQG
jgi:N-acetylmuramoyl-L-alanine amidase